MRKVILGILSLGLLLSLLSTHSAFAWHPVGSIKKSVQNVTLNGAVSDANTLETAVQVRPGDVVKYTITVSNDGKDNSRGYNDMAFINVTDVIPVGLELVDQPSVRTISYSVDTLKPGAKDSRTYTMKVTSTTDKAVITNEACFTGDSTVKDQPQAGCDTALVRLTVPQTSSTSTVKPTPVVQAAVTLPKTGVGNIFTIGFLAGSLAYAGSLFMQKRRLN